MGSLKRLANVPRPDIVRANRLVAKFANRSRVQRWKAIAILIQSLAGTGESGITLRMGQGQDLATHADSEYARETYDGRYLPGKGAKHAGAVASWFSRIKRCVTFLTTEAEYVAMSGSVNEALSRLRFLRFHSRT